MLTWLGVKDYHALFEERGVKNAFKIKNWDSKELFKYGLLWARQGMSFDDLGLYLNKDGTTASRRMSDWIGGLYPWAHSQIELPALAEWILHHPEKLREQFPQHLFFFVDGTVLKVCLFVIRVAFLLMCALILLCYCDSVSCIHLVVLHSR